MSSDPRRRNNNTSSSNLSTAAAAAAAAASSSSSSSYLVGPNPQDDLTWLDFLRTAGGTVSADSRPHPPVLDRSNSADRKRRHTGTEPERRGYPYPTYNTRPANPPPHSSSASRAPPSSNRPTPTDLITHSRRPHAPYTSSPHLHQSTQGGIDADRRGSDIVLPCWQPDGEVDSCPVCDTHFSILFRRHHCRKCGRVVCANCSPHRITIPRQYIVQPPNPYYEDEAAPSDSPPRINPALGGGEVVRVCNPCVPDPWTPHAIAVPPAHPPIAPIPPPPPPTHRNFPFQQPNRDPRLQLQRDSRFREGAEWERSGRYRQVSDGGVGRSGSFSQQQQQQRHHHHQQQQQQHQQSNITPTERSEVTYSVSTPTSQGSLHPNILQRYDRHYPQNNTGHGMPPILPTAPMPPTTAPPPPPPQSRREVAEEDECPVCGTEMPPGESIREAHIQECIASRFASTPTQPTRSAPPVADATISSPFAAPSTSVPSNSTSPPVPEASRPRATSYRPRGMALYRATEKDCTTDDGEPQECVICFEEFQPGDEMGRMECLCKFHRLCIRQWWDTKGAGSCPTHQLHD